LNVDILWIYLIDFGMSKWFDCILLIKK
jgi:hypothetical protein